MYLPLLRSAMGPIIKEHTAAAMAKNGHDVARANNIATNANRTVPQGTGRPVAQPVHPIEVTRKPGESPDEFVRRRLDAIFQSQP
jgi:hypothetical protein